MHTPDLEKLRKFSLSLALVIITYSIAGISVDPKSNISFVGFSFKVSKPELLPAGLIISSMYAMVSFYYYGYMLKKSPFRVRRDILDGLNAWEPKFVPGKKIPVYFGPTEFETSPWYDKREKIEEYVEYFHEAFPKFAWVRASAEVISSQSFNEDGEPYMTYAAKVVIPVQCRIAAIFQDVDFASPVWLNAFALTVFFWTR